MVYSPRVAMPLRKWQRRSIMFFYHPNVGPFMARHLIQRLVTRNPTPAYVARVATVFNNNGVGVRGDLKALVRAILLDTEARFGRAVWPGKTAPPFPEKTLMDYSALKAFSANPTALADRSSRPLALIPMPQHWLRSLRWAPAALAHIFPHLRLYPSANLGFMA